MASSRDIKRLTKAGEQAAIAGAMDYAVARNCDIDPRQLGDALQRHIEAALPEALAPFQRAKAGKDAHTTFLSTMRLAGISAAKEVDGGKAKRVRMPRPFRG